MGAHHASLDRCPCCAPGCPAPCPCPEGVGPHRRPPRQLARVQDGHRHPHGRDHGRRHLQRALVLNEEVVILGSFVIFLGYVSNLVREPYREWADGQIQKVKDILNSSRAAHTAAVGARIESVQELKEVEQLTKQLFELSKQTAELEHETFRLKQEAAIASEIKSVLDSHVRHEAQLREQEQRDLVATVLGNVQKQLGDKKLQRDILLSSVAEVESLVKSKAI